MVLIFFDSLIKTQRENQTFTHIFLPALFIVFLDILRDVLRDVVGQVLGVKHLRLPADDLVELQQYAGAAILEAIMVFPGAVSLEM